MPSAHRCPGCPRSHEQEGLDRDDVRGKACGKRGPKNAIVTCVGIAPGKDELLAGIPFVGGSGRLLAAAFAYAGVKFDDIRAVNLINCYPLGANEIPTDEQICACSQRFKSDLEECSSPVLLLLGQEPLRVLTGFVGQKQSISYWHGYPIPRQDLPPEAQTCLPPTVHWLVPSYHPAFVMRKGNKPFPWLREAVRKAVALSRGELTPAVAPAANAPWATSPQEFAFDIETQGLGETIERISFAWEGGSTSAPWDLRTRAHTERLLGSKALKIVFNGSFDIPRLRKQGIRVEGPFWDVMLCGQLLDPDAPGYSLNALAAQYLCIPRWKHKGNPGSRPKSAKTQVWKRDKPCVRCGKGVLIGKKVKDGRLCQACMEEDRQSALAAWGKEEETYSRNDSHYLLPMKRIQVGELIRTEQMDVWRRMQEVFPTLVEMQETGIKVDPQTRDRIAKRYERWATWSEEAWGGASGGIKPGAHKAIGTLLYETWGLPVQYREEKVGGERTQKPTVEKSALQELLPLAGEKAIPIRLLLLARHYRKWAQTYTQIGDWIYPAYGPETKDEGRGGKRFGSMASTGRIIAKGNTWKGTSTPPIQQIPKALRRMFVPSDPSLVFVEADYGSQELRLVAYQSGDKALIHAIEHGIDLHEEVAARLGISRKAAKGIDYGALYGGRGKTVHRSMKAQGFDMTLAEIEEAIAVVRGLYPRVFEWHKELDAEARRQHYLTNPFGRRRYFYDPKASYNEILNFPVQSTGADILWSIVNPVHELAKEHGGRLVALVHDSVLTEVQAARAEEFTGKLSSLMSCEWPQVAPGFKIPVEVKQGRCWPT